MPEDPFEKALRIIKEIQIVATTPKLPNRFVLFCRVAMALPEMFQYVCRAELWKVPAVPTADAVDDPMWRDDILAIFRKILKGWTDEQIVYWLKKKQSA